MAITVSCKSCGRKFVAPPEFEGKRVKCKGCGEIILITAGPTIEGNPDGEQDPLALLAQSAGGNQPGGADTREARMPTGVQWDDSNDPKEDADDLYPNVLKFGYPGSSDVDKWLPAGLIAIGFLMLATFASEPDVKGFGWIALVRFLTPAALYAGVIFPIILSMIRRAGKELRYSMPPQFKLRCFGCYMPAIVIIGLLWMTGCSTGVLLFGAVFGLAVSSATVWLLFRLRDSDVGTTSAYGAGGFAVGVALSFGLILGVNAISQTIVEQSKAVASVPVSPFGPGLSWAALPPPPPAVSPPPVAPAPAPTTVMATNVAGSNQIGQFETSKIPGIIDDVIEPISTSPVVGIVRSKANQLSIEPWNTQEWEKQPGTLNLPPHSASKFILSADGRHIAWIAEFPRLSVQVWSFEDANVSSHIDLDRADGTANLICFIDSNRLLVERSGPKPVVIEAPTVPAGTAATIPPPTPAPAVKPKPKHTSIFDDFATNPNTVNRPPGAAQPPTESIAVKKPPVASNDAAASEQTVIGCEIQVLDAAAAVTLCSFTLPPLVQDDSGTTADSTSSPSGIVHLGTNSAVSPILDRLVAVATTTDTPMLLQYDLVTGKRLAAIKIGEIDPSLSGSPAGLAYSNDGKKLAVLFEHNESALLLSYDLAAGHKPTEFVYPFGPLEGQPHGKLQGGAIAWLDPAPFWLVYGEGLINTDTSVHLKTADLGLANVERQRLLDLDRVELLLGGPGGQQLKILDLDPMKLGLDPASATEKNP